MAVNENYIRLTPMLYPGVMVTEPRLLGTLDVMWLAFQTRETIRHQPPTAKNKTLCLLFRGVRGHPPRWGPGLAVMGAVRVGRLPSRLHARRDRAIDQSIPYCTDPWLDASSKSRPLNKHHYAEVYAARSSIQTNDVLCRTAYLRHPPALPPSEKTGATAWTATKTRTHSNRVDTLSLTRAVV